MRQATLDVQQSGEQRVPLVYTVAITRAMFVAQSYQVAMPLAEVRHLNVDNRYVRPILVAADTVNQTQGLMYAVDPGEKLVLAPEFPLYALTVTDMYAAQALPQNLPFLTGQLDGIRSPDQLPFQGVPTGFSGTVPTWDGVVLITVASRPIGVHRVLRTPPSKVNWLQQALASGVGTATLTASAGAIQNNMRSAGYFNLLMLANPTVSTFTVQPIPVGGNLNVANAPSFTVLGSSSMSVPFECEQVNITFTAANQQVLAYQPVVMAASVAEP